MWIALDKRADYFAVFVVLNGDDGGRENRRVGEEDIFDFEGEDVFAA
jgi:hypothetical protein